MKEPHSSTTNVPPRTHGMRQVRAEGSRLDRQVLLPTEEFIHSETISGALLLVCAIAALVWANSPWSHSYFAVRHTPVAIQIGTFALSLDLQHWINDGLMAIFFFVVALEIKRELIYGDLSESRKAALPVAAALGGMILPAGIYLVFNVGGKGASGWGIPTATDIAFAVTILALLGKLVPSHLRIFLLTFAIVDDVGAILVIAIYYTAHFSLTAMWVAIAALGLMLAMRALGFRSTMAYMFPAIIFWAAMLKSGVHATIAGVILGAITPAKSLGRKSTFIEAVQDTLPKVRDSFDKEESERSEVILGRIEELARQTESPLQRLERGVGEFVVNNTALPSLAMEGSPDKRWPPCSRLTTSAATATVEQNSAFGMRQIVDVALKALSPGINDTTTAVTCVDYLTALLARLAPRQLPSSRCFDGKSNRQKLHL